MIVLTVGTAALARLMRERREVEAEEGDAAVRR